jgi:hypothetical protein
VTTASGYVLTANGTLHRWPALEQCNLDDARIERSYEVLPVSRTGAIVPPGKLCKHCKPLADLPLPLPEADRD